MNIFKKEDWKNYDYQKANARLKKEVSKMDVSALTLDDLLKIYDADIALEIANAYHLPQGHEIGGI